LQSYVSLNNFGIADGLEEFSGPILRKVAGSYVHIILPSGSDSLSECDIKQPLMVGKAKIVVYEKCIILCY
jgi:hypothetical protein